jgi:hypothetical protein
MKVNVLSAWQNFIVEIQRRSSTAGVTSLGEPNYGIPSTWPIVPNPRDSLYSSPSEWTNNPADYTYPYHNTRIEFNVENLQFTPTGERVVQNQTLMFVAATDYMQPEDRITIISMNNVPANTDPGLGNYFIALAVWTENDSMGNTSHLVVELQGI